MIDWADPLGVVYLEACVIYSSYVRLSFIILSNSCKWWPKTCFLLIPPPHWSTGSLACLWYNRYSSLELLGKGHHVLNNSINYVQWVLGTSIRVGDSKLINPSLSLFIIISFLWKVSKCILCWLLKRFHYRIVHIEKKRNDRQEICEWPRIGRLVYISDREDEMWLINKHASNAAAWKVSCGCCCYNLFCYWRLTLF